jgi:hypothetical protein
MSIACQSPTALLKPTLKDGLIALPALKTRVELASGYKYVLSCSVELIIIGSGYSHTPLT